MTRKPTKKCRVFVSRKTDDKRVGTKIREALKDYSGNLEFFDAEDIQGGVGWLRRLREELKIANLLVLVLTKPARNDFDWPLYEAGLFDSLDEEDHRKVICVYADPGESNTSGDRAEMEVPSQLLDRQAVKATREDLLNKLLVPLFHDKTFTNTIDALNPNVSKERLSEIAEIIADEINDVESDRVRNREYTNTFLQLLLPPECDSLAPETVVKSNSRSLEQLFGLGRNAPGGQQWTWGQISERIPHKDDPAGFNRRWAQQLEEAISAMKASTAVQQLSGRFLAANGRLYRPEIEIYRVYENDALNVDVTFSEQVQDAWLRNARAPVALAANLSLASRIRHELLEPYRLKLTRWRTDQAKKDGCAEMAQLVEQIEHDGYFIERLTGSRLQEAFDAAETRELGRLYVEFVEDIRPRVEIAIRDIEIGELGEALERWRENNLAFLHIGLRRYEAMLEPRGPQELAA